MPTEKERERGIADLLVKALNPREYDVSNVTADVRVNDLSKTIHVQVRYKVSPNGQSTYCREQRCATLIYQCTNSYWFGYNEYDVYFDSSEMSHVFYKCNYDAVMKVHNKYTHFN